jgi:hypothetical protein
MALFLKTGIPARVSIVLIFLSATLPCPALRVNARRSLASLPFPLWDASDLTFVNR